MEVTPVSITQIDFPALLRAGRDGTGKNLTAVLDKVGQPVGSPLSMLAILGAVDGRGFTLNEAAVRDVKNLQHLFYGFAVVGQPHELRCLVQFLGGRLAITIHGNWGFAVLSGSLDKWKDIISEGFSDPVITETMTSIGSLFNGFGLGSIWNYDGRRS